MVESEVPEWVFRRAEEKNAGGGDGVGIDGAEIVGGKRKRKTNVNLDLLSDAQWAQVEEGADVQEVIQAREERKQRMREKRRLLKQQRQDGEMGQQHGQASQGQAGSGQVSEEGLSIEDGDEEENERKIVANGRVAFSERPERGEEGKGKGEAEEEEDGDYKEEQRRTGKRGKRRAEHRADDIEVFESSYPSEKKRKLSSQQEPSPTPIPLNRPAGPSDPSASKKKQSKKGSSDNSKPPTPPTSNSKPTTPRSKKNDRFTPLEVSEEGDRGEEDEDTQILQERPIGGWGTKRRSALHASGGARSSRVASLEVVRTLGEQEVDREFRSGTDDLENGEPSDIPNKVVSKFEHSRGGKTIGRGKKRK
eukprot:TRINITY_DN27557_c0_g1_i1.p1 TRINITY_DN27557_c0_g1~~TRINITY_DN27557_c0_g1_i1.p1  ORF type:complete len:412 (-),score=91.26 TRINITY_DN27557_c0_g1_i1:4-1095(-)